ncbi:Transposase, Mutator family [Sphingobium sp. AP50]|nr:Transposase, Mutator family [Sphingobium sp. AP50]
MSRRKGPSLPNDILDQLFIGTDAAAALSQGGLLDPLKKAFAERALTAEMGHHLGQEEQGSNSWNGYGRKTVTTDSGRIEIKVPRDRAGSFDPQLIAKYQRRFPGFDDKIISMYARGIRTREITGHLRDLYGIGASPDLISRSLTQSWRKSRLDSNVRWIRPIRWFSLMRSGSRSATRAWSAIKQPTLPWASWALAPTSS